MTVSSAPSGAHSADGAVATATPAALPLSQPTPCPSWCKDRNDRMGHHFGPTGTYHWGRQYAVPNPRPLEDTEDFILTAELVVGDEDDRLGATYLYVQGGADAELSPDETDLFIAQLQALLDTVKVMRRQMG